MTREPEDTATEISQNETQKGREIKKKKKTRLSISCGSTCREGKRRDGGKYVKKFLKGWKFSIFDENQKL